MTFRLSTSESSSRPGRLWLQLLLWAGFLLSLLIGLGALIGVNLLPDLEQETALVASDPVLLVEPDRIPPHLALLQLAGAGGDALARQATIAGQRTLAYSVLVYDGALTPSRQANELLRVGRQFLAADDPLRAVAAFNRARVVTLFALPMPALERGQILARDANAIFQAGDPAGALQTAIQAQRVAAQAARLLPAQRAQILQAVESIIRSRGDAEAVQRLDELLRAPGQVPERVALISRLPALRADYPAPATLADVRTARMAAAQSLIDRILLTGGQDIEPERATLAEALLAEDRLRGEIYAGWNDPALPLAQRHALLLDYRNWVLVKLRVAEGGYGLRLVDRWAGETDALRGALGQAMSELSALLDAQIDAEADPVLRAMLRLEALRWLTLQAELGFYPDAPLGDLSARLEATQAELETLSVPPDLPLFYDVGANPPGFRIARRYR